MFGSKVGRDFVCVLKVLMGHPLNARMLEGLVLEQSCFSYIFCYENNPKQQVL